MKIYISGAMTGLPDFNKPAFFAAEKALLDAGYEVVNPARNGLPDSAEWHQHMRADIKMLMDCDGVALLPGWGLSKGANIESEIASGLGFDVRTIDEWLLPQEANPDLPAPRGWRSRAKCCKQDGGAPA